MTAQYTYSDNRLPSKKEALGVTTPDQWKRAAVLFDKLWVPSIIRVPVKGYLIQPQTGDIPPELTFGAYKVDELVTSRFSPVIYGRPGGAIEITGDESERQHLYDAFLRPVAKVYADLGFAVTPVYPSQSLFSSQFTKGEAVAYQAALNNLPLLDEGSVTWDEILSFRQDSNAVKKVRRLRLWLVDGLNCESVNHATDVIAARIEDYTWALRKHGLKTVTGGITHVAAAGGTAALLDLLEKPLYPAIAAGLLATAKTIAWVSERMIEKKDILSGPKSEVAILYDAKQAFKATELEPRMSKERPEVIELYRDRGTVSSSSKEEETGAHAFILATLTNSALELARIGKRLEAAQRASSVIHFCGEKVSADHPCILACRRVIVLSLFEEGKFEEAERELLELIPIHQRETGLASSATLGLRHHLALILLNTGRYAEAEIQNREILELRESAEDCSADDMLASLYNLACALYRQHRIDEAETHCREALTRFENEIGETHPDILACRNVLGCILDQQGAWLEAETEHRKTLGLRETALGLDHIDLYQSCYNLALPLVRQLKFEQALEFAHRSLEGRTRLLGLEDPGTQDSSKLVAAIQTALQAR